LFDATNESGPDVKHATLFMKIHAKVNPDGNQCIKTVRHHVHFCHQVSVSTHLSLDVKVSMGYCMKDKCSLFEIILKDGYILSTYKLLFWC
jgi:hypothetical protein